MRQAPWAKSPRRRCNTAGLFHDDLTDAEVVDALERSAAGAADAKIPLGPGYQVPFAARIRQETGILTGAVGMITTPQQADEIIRSGQADLILMAREFLRDPYFALHAASALGEKPAPPVQYGRAFS